MQNNLATIVLERTGLALERHLTPQFSLMWSALTTKEKQQLIDTLQQQKLVQPAWQDLLKTLAINETYFMRDRPHLHMLLRHIVQPIVLERLQKQQHHLSIWIAGCATGEEAYSLLILLYESLPEIRRWDLALVASDINETAIAHAKQGFYRTWSFRGSDYDTWRTPYFNTTQDGWQIRDQWRDRIEFRQENLLEAHYHNRFDVILCRHVLMYFGETTRILAERILLKALKARGWLVLGRVEEVPSANLWQIYALKDHRFYQRPTTDTLNSTQQNIIKTINPAKADDLSDQHSDKPTGASLKDTRSSNLYEQALSAWRSDDPAQAQAYLASIPANQMTAAAYTLQATLAADKQDYIGAETALNQALMHDNLVADAYYVRGIIAIESEDISEARQALQAALYCDQRHILSTLWLGNCYQLEGNIARARHFWQRTLEIADTRPDDDFASPMSLMRIAQLRDLARQRLQEQHPQDLPDDQKPTE